MSQPGKQQIHKDIDQASRLINSGHNDQAEVIFQNLVGLDIDDVDTLTKLGSLALNLGNTVFAIKVFTEAVDARPDNATYLDLLASALIQSGITAKAETLLRKAIELDPQLLTPYIRLGNLTIDNGQFEDAAELLAQAIKLKPSNPAPYGSIVYALRNLGRHSETLEYARKLLKLEPGSSNSHQIMGRVLSERGQTDEAIAHFKKAINLDKTNGLAFHEIASITKFKNENDPVIRQAEQALQLSMPSLPRSYIQFSLGKMYDDCKAWDKAFDHYKQANLLGKPPTQEDSTLTRFKRIKQTYTRKLLQQADSIGSDSDVPVFVVGMPRSGTTLIEQIIASHPDAAGAGELTEMDRIEETICPSGKIGDYQKQFNTHFNREEFNKLSKRYLQVLCANKNDVRRIVDKMPDNYVNLGLIHLLFPKAHIVHVIRHPLDTCLSCYFQPFTYLPWTYDLDWIAKRYRFYREAMDFWKETLPENRYTDIRYEELVADPANASKHLIESCGLAWDDSCLEYYKQKNAINTASIWQARQPIYTSSRQRWTNYAPHIQELASELRDFLSDEDLKEFDRLGVKLKKKWKLPFF